MTLADKFLTSSPEYAPPQEKREQPWWMGIWTGVNQTAAADIVFGIAQNSAFDNEPGFQLTAEQIKELSENVPTEKIHRFADAGSIEEAWYIKAMIEHENDVARVSSELGSAGKIAEFGANIADPAYLTADLITFGVARGANALRGATKATKAYMSAVEGGTALSRARKALAFRTGYIANRFADRELFASAMRSGGSLNTALRYGTLNAVADMVAEGAAMQANEDRGSVTNFALGATTAFVLSGSIMGLLDKSSVKRAMKAHENMKMVADLDSVESAGAVLNELGEKTKKALGDTMQDAWVLEQSVFDELVHQLPTAYTPQEKGIFKLLRKHITGKGAASSDEVTRKLFSMSVAQGAAPKGSKIVLSATELRDMRRAAFVGQIGAPYMSNFKAWGKSIGLSKLDMLRTSAMNNFDDEIMRYIRNRKPGFKVNPEVKKVGDLLAKRYQWNLNRYRAAFPEIAGDIPDDLSYAPRIWRADVMDTFIGESSVDELHEFVSGAIRSGSRELDDETIKKLAKLIVQNVQDDAGRPIKLRGIKEVGNHERMSLRSLVEADRASASPLLSKADGDKLLSLGAKSSDTPNFMRHRIPMDESYSAFVNGKEWRIDDFFDNRAFNVAASYESRIDSLILSKKIISEVDPDGAIGISNLEGVIEHVRTSRLKKAADQAERNLINSELDALDAAFRHIDGRPMYDVPDGVRKASSILKSYNHGRIAGKFTIAQVAEIGSLLGEAGIKTFSMHMPAFLKVLKRAEDGQLADPFLRELQTIFHLGLDGTGPLNLNRIAASGMDDYLRRVGNLENLAKKTSTATAHLSGFHMLDSREQLMSAAIFCQKFTDGAFGSRGFALSRLSAAGLSKADESAIFEQIRKHVTRTKTKLGWKVNNMNLSRWDKAVAAKFVSAGRLFSGRVIQKNNIGFATKWMSYPLAELVFQFRSFVINAWDKQFLWGVRNMDKQTAMMWSSNLFFGGLSFTTLIYMNSIGRPDADSFRKRMLTPSMIAKGAIQRAGWAGAVPLMVDTVPQIFGQEPVFSYEGRTSGLSSGLLMGNPTSSLITTLPTAVTDITGSIFSGEKSYEYRDFMNATRLLPWNNLPVIQNMLQAIGGATFPSKRK